MSLYPETDWCHPLQHKMTRKKLCFVITRCYNQALAWFKECDILSLWRLFFTKKTFGSVRRTITPQVSHSLKAISKHQILVFRSSKMTRNMLDVLPVIKQTYRLCDLHSLSNGLLLAMSKGALWTTDVTTFKISHCLVWSTISTLPVITDATTTDAFQATLDSSSKCDSVSISGNDSERENWIKRNNISLFSMLYIRN